MSRGRKPKSNDTNLSWQQIFSKNVGKYLQKIIVELSLLDNQSLETGIELLNKIKAEKGQIKKELLPIEAKEIRYDIPKNWVWCRLGEIGESTIGVIFSPNQVGEKGIPVLRANNVQNNKIDYSDLILVDMQVREKQIAKRGDILICVRSGSNNLIGKAAIIEKEDMSFGAFMTLYRSPVNKYVYRFMTSELFKQQIDDKKSTGINQLTQGTLNNVLIPLPPISEQEKILDFLNDFENNNLKEDGYYFNQEVEQKVIALHESQLKGFEISNELSYQLSLVKNLRQQLLQDAVQGKLVKNGVYTEGGQKNVGEVSNLADVRAAETGSQLLQRIKKEKEQLIKDKKLKKEKELPPIKAEEMPFEIPDDWVWCRLGEIALTANNGLYKPESFYKESGFISLRMFNIQDGSINIKKVKRVILDEKELKTYLLEENDILVNRVNSIDLVGKAAIIKDIGEPLVFESMNIRLRLVFKDLMAEYVNLVLRDKRAREYFYSCAKIANGQVSVNQTQLFEFLIPLPPLSIQHRIVEKVESLMSLCAALETSIGASVRENEALLQQVLREALQR